ncbi:MAG TPA: bifunctional glutamate N-acetyltransferase/amino-acid acetyltransferase ArgJ [Gaiellaceae bacterium]|nr:bifunctional glutamate N-acetyltransferase/amino-acid acetyltransferase ArgJ [Gaiellaceae bacterium]
MSVTAAKGFVATGVHCGIRKKGRRDLALVRSLLPATGAGMFTANRVPAAPVVVSRDHLELAEPQAVVVNSGVANAATGADGVVAARTTAAEAAWLLGLRPEQVLVLSTGVIGAPLPLDKVVGGVRSAALGLARSGGGTAAEAIMTTDTRAKETLSRGDGFVVGGMAKGSGMIHPNLATMLAVVTTDYPLDPGEAIAFLRPAVEASFNSISVDGECSTNDSVILLANGASGVERTPASDEQFGLCLRTVCAELARQIVADGEGATVVARIAVRGAATTEEARAIAERVATSPLVKTALHGRDANWGRIASAAGSARHDGGYAQLDPDRLTIVVDEVPVLLSGRPTGEEPALANGHCAIELDLALGSGAATYLTTDLSSDYVRINAEYRS